MEFKAQPIPVENENPFAHDALNRRPSINAVSNLIDNLKGPFVLAIDSPWGTGKTTFVRMLKAVLENKKYLCLYFNAWESDYATDPMIAFLHEINMIVSSQLPENRKIVEYFDKVKKIAPALALNMVSVAGKFITGGAADIKDIYNEFIEAGEDKQISGPVEEYTARKELIAQFKKSLVESISALYEGKKKTPEEADESQEDKDQSQLVIFVDELDRCRPTYSIELLERVKHIFDLENTVFVLSYDKQQLGVSIGAIYGQEINSLEYLRRFIDLEFTLPEPNSKDYTNYLIKRYGFGEFFENRVHGELRFERDNLIEVFSRMSNPFKMSLRTMEQCFTIIRIAMIKTDKNQYFFPQIVVAMAILKVIVPELYKNYAFGKADAQEIVEYIEKLDLDSSFLDSHSGKVVEAFLIAAKSKTDEFMDVNNKLKTIIENDTISDKRRDRAKNLIGILNDRSNKFPSLQFIVNRIELAAQFKE